MKAVKTMKLILLLLAVYLQTISGCEIYRFSPTNDMVLEGHVIKTITRAQVTSCWGECVWLSWCFSINVFKTNEMFECELNNSSKKAKPTKMVARKGWTYQEMKGVNPINCNVYDCRRKEDLGGEWYRYGDAAIKLFKEKKNWTDARSHCQSIGGDLLSITSSHENDFINDIFVSQLNLTYLRQDQPDIGIPHTHWKLNGDEPSIKFNGPSGALKYVYDDQEMALFFDGTSRGYATVPTVPLNPEGFTVGFWVKPYEFKKSQTPFHITDADKKSKIRIFSDKTAYKVRLNLNLLVNGKRSFVYNVWTYIALSWNKTTTVATYVVRGTQEPFNNTMILSPPLTVTSHDNILLGVNDVAAKSSSYRGLIKHLMLFNASLVVDQMQTFAYWNDHGAWIGLYNEGHTTIYKWSDNSPVMNGIPLPLGFETHPTTVKKCVIAGKNGKWVDKYCEMEYPFICEKKLM